MAAKIRRKSTIDGHWPSLVKCPRCSQKMLSDQVSSHLAKEHEKIDPQIARQRIDQALDQLGNLRRLPSTEEESPDGEKVLNTLASGKKWSVVGTQHCTCGQRVTYLSMSLGTCKAFDVGEDMIIKGAHVCEYRQKSESVFAWSGGIVDSNRRKH